MRLMSELIIYSSTKESEFLVKSYYTPGIHSMLNGVQLVGCVEVLWPSQPNRVMSSAVSLPNHTFTGQA